MSNNFLNLISSIGLPRPDGILQVGASYGQELHDFINAGINSALLIEALPEPFNYISNLCKQIPGYIAFNALCSDAPDQSHSFYISSNAGQSSSILQPHKHMEIFEEVKFEESINMTSTTVDQIIDFLNKNNYTEITKSLNALYMDVQGAEFKVLLGSPKTLKQIDYIYTEIIRGDLYKNTTSLDAYCSLLHAHGFTLNNINFNMQHHADALFVRRKILGLQ
jgi:FkbM family methyltransferase